MGNPNRYFFDTEFIETGDSIYLISIGMVSDDGREFYAEIVDEEIPWDKAHPWVLENVRPLLHAETKWRKADLSGELLNFILRYPQPEFWAWYGSYDWVAFCQIFGSMVQLPTGFPMFQMDLKVWAEMLGNPELPRQEGTKHDALEDARWNRQAFNYLREIAKSAPPYIP